MKATLFFAIFLLLLTINHIYAQTPVLTSFSPISAKIGETVTISGSGFHANPDSSIVYFGTMRADVLSATPLQLLVRVPSGASYGPVKLHTRGYTVLSNLNFIPTFDGATLNTNAFSQNIDFPVSNTNFSKLLAADFNLDGRPDIIKYPGMNSMDISFFENKADSGMFNDTCLKAEISVFSYGNDTNIIDLIIHDFNHDSLPDIIALVWLNHNVIMAGGTRKVWLDFIENTSTSSAVSFGNKQSILVRDGTLPMAECTGGPFGTSLPTITKGWLNICDLNYDAVPDYMMTLSWENNVCTNVSNKNHTEIFSATGIYSAGSTLAFNIESVLQTSVDTKMMTSACAEMNNDGKQDRVLSFFSASTNTNNTSLFTNTNLQGGTTINWIEAAISGTTIPVHEEIMLLDIDLDTKPDFFRSFYGVARRNTHVSGNLSATSLGPNVNMYINDAYVNVVWADINGDSRPDPVSLKVASNAVNILQNNCQPGTISYASFNPVSFTILGSQPTLVCVQDLDQDGKPEVITGNTNNVLSVLKNLVYAEFILDTMVCANQNDTITYSGSAGAGATFIWDFDGADTISGSGLGPWVVAWQTPGIKTVSLTVIDNGDTTIVSKNANVLSVPTSTFSLPQFIYINESSTITYTGTAGTAASYTWNFDGGNIVSGSGQGPYELTWTLAGNRQLSLSVAENGCYSDTTVITKTIFSVYQEERLCVVNVDPVSGKNMVVWEKTPGVNIASYNIYKEVATNFYSWIANVPYNNMSTYVDANSSPEVHPDRYKISILDSMGSESLRSPYHMTIHLQASAGVPSTNINLSWTHYYDEEGVFVPAKYYIFRGTLPTNLSLLDSVSGSYSTYTDVNVYNPYFYMIGAIRLDGCNPTANKSIYNGPNSNIKDISGLVQLDNMSAASRKLSIYPNPAKDICVIKLPSEEKQILTVTVHDITGKTVLQWQCDNEHLSFEIDALSSGLYTIKVKGEFEYFGRFVIE